MSRSTESLTSAKMADVPPTIAVVPSGAASRATCRIGPRTRSIEPFVKGPSASAMSMRAPCRSGVGAGAPTELTPSIAARPWRNGRSCSSESAPDTDLTYTCCGSLAPSDNAAEILSAVRVAAVEGPPSSLS